MQYTRIENGNYYLITLPTILEKEETKDFVNEVVKLCKEDIDNNGWIVLDGEELRDYTVSGLKELRRFRDYTKNIIIINLCDDIYDLFTNVGYTDIFFVYKTFKQIDLGDAKRIGGGNNGSVYNLGDGKALKVYSDQVTLYEIVVEERTTRWAFKAGLPTSCTLGLAKVDDKLALLFEYTDIKGIAKYLVEDSEHFDEYIKEYAKFLKEIDTIEADTEFLPSKKDEFKAYLREIKDVIDNEHYSKIAEIINNIPDNTTIVHGDAHARNIRYSKDGLRVIDLGDLGYGDPLFELVALYATYVGYRAISTNDLVKIGNDNYGKVWRKLLPYMYPELNEKELKEKENLIAAIAYVRILRHCITYNELKQNTEIIKQKLKEALDNF